MTGPLNSPGREKALLVGLVRPEDPVTHEPPLSELGRLANTAGAEVVSRIIQKRRKAQPATFVGSGKAAEIGEMIALAWANARQKWEIIGDWRDNSRTFLVFAWRTRPSISNL